MRVLAAFVAALVVAGTVSASTTNSRSGLQGRVLRAPAQPVCVSLRPCSTPVSVVLAFFRSGRERAHVRSSRNGEYRVSLAPGRYSVRVAHRHPLWRALPQTARVPVGGYARVNFFVDTGIQ
jgi:hypothetical protein